jgi:uncharacterized protein YegP (UPF0339 family)
MGTFYIKKNARGVRFLLRSETGRALTESADYATLDACKKGIASLIVNAPLAPVRDLTMGERGANPKFEITGREGAFVFCLKSPNGKCVVTSAPFATRKACLRAISMLRLGVADYEIVMERREEKIPLVIAAQMKQQAAVPAVKPAVPKPAATEEIITEETTFEEPITEEPIVEEAAAEEAPAPIPQPQAQAPAAETPRPTAAAPRVTRIKETGSIGGIRPQPRRVSPAPRSKNPVKPPRKQSFFEWLLKK